MHHKNKSSFASPLTPLILNCWFVLLSWSETHQQYNGSKKYWIFREDLPSTIIFTQTLDLGAWVGSQIHFISKFYPLYATRTATSSSLTVNGINPLFNLGQHDRQHFILWISRSDAISGNCGNIMLEPIHIVVGCTVERVWIPPELVAESFVLCHTTCSSSNSTRLLLALPPSLPLQINLIV